MKLEIISPKKKIFSGEVELVTLPGTLGRFTILQHHAPIISSLTAGDLLYRVGGQDVKIEIKGGFVEMNHDLVSVCIE